MRRKVIAGNWKMNKTPAETTELIKELIPHVKENNDVDIVLCVPSIDIPAAVKAVKGTNIAIGAQNMHYEESGAYTGEVSAEMLKNAGAQYVIIGHSERREYFAETDKAVNKKIIRALDNELIPIVCCGETDEQRDLGITFDWIRIQIKIAVRALTPKQVEGVVFAYEPIWAIGTGLVATREQAQEVCHAIRACIAELYNDEIAQKVRILYGGSVSGAYAPELFAMDDIDGGLVGGASLKLDFAKIVNFDR